MIVFSSKEYNIDRLVKSAKGVLLDKKVVSDKSCPSLYLIICKCFHHITFNVFINWIQIDPYLQLVEDYKLQAVNFPPESLTIIYGSKEDDDRATQTLSELLGSINETREIFASEIIKCLEMFAKVKLPLVFRTVNR